MRRARLIALLVILAGIIFGCGVLQFDPLIGTWKYSDYPNGTYTEETWVFSFGNGFSVSGVLPDATTYSGDGTYTSDGSHLSITAKLSAASPLFHTATYTLNGQYTITGTLLSFTFNGHSYDYYRQ